MSYTYYKIMCPRGEIGRHKGLKILALLGVPVRVWPRAPLNYLKITYAKKVFHFKNFGALGQTRTGTPIRARILSPLCLPISPRGHFVIFIVIVNILIHKSFK